MIKSESWNILDPLKNEYGNIEFFEDYYERIKSIVEYSHIPSKVFEQWLWAHHDKIESINNYGWLEYEKIHFELFNTIVVEKKNDVVETSTQTSHVQIKLDGRSFEFDLPFNNKSILDAALATGADLPYACKGGVCTTCKAKLLQGKVQMDINYGLEPSEVEEGYILTCQSHPTTASVVVDFDVK